METLTYKSSELLKNKLCNKNAWERWAEFSYGLLNSDNIVPLWADKNFRWGYQLVLNIKDAVNTWDPDNYVHKTLDRDKAIERIIDMFEEEDGVECCLTLIKGIEILIADPNEREHSRKLYPEVYSDLKLLLVVAQKAHVYRKISNAMDEELERVSAEN